ncbi:MAG: flagellar hook-basal body complex protein [Clostridiaceae bacterium]|nr:flagellar hook-basal body complex protein [Clostridiaceae bacterium]
MMRSLYSGVAGLTTHQTKMDVIGNNIANVNTVGFKSSSVNFSDTFYQTTSSASGANADLGTAGTNAKQIGLGSTVAAITTNITEAGGTSTTNRALDIAINGDSFLVVRSGTGTYFTKSGALNIDDAGNLYCTTNGAIVQGWLADDDGNIIKDTVKDLAVMTASSTYYEPEATTAVTISGNIDPSDTDLTPTYDANGVPIDGGEVTTFSFYDNLGESYTVKLYISLAQDQTTGTVTYDVRVADVLDSDSNSIFVTSTTDATTGVTTYTANTNAVISFGGVEISGSQVTVDSTTGKMTLTCTADQIQQIQFSSSTGEFVSTTERDNAIYNGSAINFSVISVDGTNTGDTSSFPQHDTSTDEGGLNIYFNDLTQYSAGGSSKISSVKGDADGYNTGNKAGNMTGISIDSEGKIWGSYDNGLTKCLAQIAVATFANPSGLEAAGNSLYAASLNSGDFDGVGEEVSLSGSFTVGALEMSNVDLATEFTQMIITQRGFQANSRIITTSDSMLEELVNLKR